MSTKPLTADQIAQLETLEAGWRRTFLGQWKVEGYDVSRYAKELKPPKPPVPVRLAVSTIGDRVKDKTAWTGIYGCGKCKADAEEMNTYTADGVRERLEHFAQRMKSNVIAMSRGHGGDGLSWLQKQYNRIAAAGALAFMGEESVLQLCRQYIEEACTEEDQAQEAARSGSPTARSEEPGPPESAAAPESAPEPTTSQPEAEPSSEG